MENTSKIVALLVTSGLITGLAFAANDKGQVEDYTLQLMKDCNVVSEQKMNAEQVSAYLALKEQEEKMDALQAPINAIEKQMNNYSDKIQELTSLAVQETASSVHIDKTYMKQQEAVAAQLHQLISDHQQDFDALEQQAHKISKVANVFETEIQASTGDLDYDQIQIISPDSPASAQKCYRGISKI